MRKNWINAALEDVLLALSDGKKLHQGWSPRCIPTPAPSDDHWGVLKTTAIQKDEFLSDENKELPNDKDPRPRIEVSDQDILITCAGPRNRCGIVCQIQKTRPKLMLSGKMYRFRADESIVLGRFLTLYLQTSQAWNDIDRMKTGGSESGLNLTQGRFKNLVVPIAPLPEQRAIVAKLDELLLELDKGVEELKSAKEKLKVYRQSVLKKAFEGELTNDWRAKYTGISTQEDWTEMTLGDFMEEKGVSLDPRKHPEEIFELYSVPSHEFGVPEIVQGSSVGSTKQKVGDGWVLLSRINPHLNRCWVVRTESDRIKIASSEWVKFPPSDNLDPDFLGYYLVCSQIKNLMLANISGVGGSLTRTNKHAITTFPLPLPPLLEQEAIVKAITLRFDSIKVLQAEIEKSIRRAEFLRNGLLKKAFKGKLLTDKEIKQSRQEMDWCSASDLFERIEKLDEKI